MTRAQERLEALIGRGERLRAKIERLAERVGLVRAATRRLERITDRIEAAGDDAPAELFERQAEAVRSLRSA